MLAVFRQTSALLRCSPTPRSPRVTRLVFAVVVVYPARMRSPVRIAPSILSADMGQLAAEVADVERAGADWIHVDIADGHYAPTLTFGPIIVEAARRATRLPLDVHLMIEMPERSVEAFAAAGADTITIHGEASRELDATLGRIRGLGKRAGIALGPEAPVESLQQVIAAVDLVLMLCVKPGFAGQRFMPEQLARIEQARRLIDASGRPIDLEVDGGVSVENARAIGAAGATVLVSGSKIFGAPDRARAIAELRQLASTTR